MTKKISEYLKISLELLVSSAAEIQSWYKEEWGDATSKKHSSYFAKTVMKLDTTPPGYIFGEDVFLRRYYVYLS